MVYLTRTREGRLEILECIIANSYHEIDSWGGKQKITFFSMNIEINQTISVSLGRKKEM